MKKCVLCGETIIGRQKTARYCGDICRFKAFRLRVKSKCRNGDNNALNGAQNDHAGVLQGVKSFTCCKNARFYSPAFNWGKVLVCDGCGAVWERKE